MYALKSFSCKPNKIMYNFEISYYKAIRRNLEHIFIDNLFLIKNILIKNILVFLR